MEGDNNCEKEIKENAMTFFDSSRAANWTGERNSALVLALMVESSFLLSGISSYRSRSYMLSQLI